MNLEELYNTCGGDLATVMGRLPSEALVRQLLDMFLQDQNYANLEKGMEENDREAAFRAAHTLKGVTGDLGLTSLYNAVVEITEALRYEDNGDPTALFPAVQENYAIAVKAIHELED